ncbi:MAG: MarR family transcriptional regulator [Armatimonadota bacterium]
MHHGQRALSIFGGIAFPWLILGIIVLAVLVGVIIWLLLQRQSHSAPERSDKSEVEQNPEGQIMAMLHQAGGPLLQTEIAANLDIPVKRVAPILKALEEKGWIHRQWRAGEYTYRVIARRT